MFYLDRFEKDKYISECIYNFFMKILIVILFLLVVILSACRPSQAEIQKRYLIDELYCQSSIDCQWARECCEFVPRNIYHPNTTKVPCEALCKVEIPEDLKLECVDNQCTAVKSEL